MSGGYGQVQVNGRRWRVHRLAWVLAYGDIPDGLVIGHSRDRGCRFRDCIRVDHLEALTLAECRRRGMHPSAVTARTNICRRGHVMTEENVMTDATTGHRRCRECYLAAQRAYRDRKRAA